MTQSPPPSQQLAAHPQCECELSHRDGNAERLKSFCHGYCYSHELREVKHWPQTFGEGNWLNGSLFRSFTSLSAVTCAYSSFTWKQAFEHA